MYATSMRRALKTYLDSTEQTLTQLSELEQLAETFSTMLETNESVRAEITDHERTVAHLLSRRTDLQQDHAYSLFNSDHARIAEIENSRDEIDRGVSELRATITELRENLIDPDPSAVSEMLQRLGEVKLPIFYNGVLPYQQGVAPTGVMNQLQAENNKLVNDVGSRKRRILDMHPWAIFAAREAVPA